MIIVIVLIIMIVMIVLIIMIFVILVIVLIVMTNVIRDAALGMGWGLTQFPLLLLFKNNPQITLKSWW